MNCDTINDLCNRLHVSALALSSITEDTDRSIVIERCKNAVAHMDLVEKALHAERDHNAHLGANKE